MNISSIYTKIVLFSLSQNIQVIRRWKVEGPLQSPICMVVLRKVPSGVENSVLCTSFNAIRICSYASVISIFDRYKNLAKANRISFWSGKGVTSRNVFAFLCLASMTVRSLPLPFGMHSIGLACWPVAGIQRPCLTYRFVFS